MMDVLSTHSQALAVLAAGALLAYLLLPMRSRLGSSEAVLMTVYCLHCNWEGRVPRVGACCSRCRSTNLSVLAI